MSGPTRSELEAAVAEELRAWRTDQESFAAAAAECARLDRTDTRCLDVLARSGPMTGRDLATAARMTGDAVTSVVDRLERLGLVRRTRDATDRRRVRVEATPEVDRLLAPVLGPLADEAARHATGYTDDELAFLLRFLQQDRAILAAQTARVEGLVSERATDEPDGPAVDC